MSDDLIRDHCRYWLPIQTRWSDNDMLGRVNNVVYFRYFETVVVKFVIEVAGLDWQDDPVVPYAVDIRCHFRRPPSFPGRVEAGLIIRRLGNSSVTYDLALFAAGEVEPAALGHFVHVYVDRVTGNPLPIPAAIRAAYERFSRTGTATASSEGTIMHSVIPVVALLGQDAGSPAMPQRATERRATTGATRCVR